MRLARMLTGTGLAPLADVPDGECRDRAPQPVVRREYSWLVSRRQAMPVLPRRWDEIGEPVQELKRREFDQAVRAGPHGLTPAAASSRCMRNHRSTRRRTRSVSAARSAWVIGRAGRNAGGPSLPASAAGGTKTPSVTQGPEVHMVVERRTEAVQEGDAAEP